MLRQSVHRRMCIPVFSQMANSRQHRSLYFSKPLQRGALTAIAYSPGWYRSPSRILFCLEPDLCAELKICSSPILWLGGLMRETISPHSVGCVVVAWSTGRRGIAGGGLCVGIAYLGDMAKLAKQSAPKSRKNRQGRPATGVRSLAQFQHAPLLENVLQHPKGDPPCRNSVAGE